MASNLAFIISRGIFIKITCHRFFKYSIDSFLKGILQVQEIIEFSGDRFKIISLSKSKNFSSQRFFKLVQTLSSVASSIKSSTSITGIHKVHHKYLDIVVLPLPGIQIRIILFFIKNI
jgi:hypothetical protein